MVRDANDPYHVQWEAKNRMLFFNKRHDPNAWCRLSFPDLFRQGTEVSTSRFQEAMQV